MVISMSIARVRASEADPFTAFESSDILVDRGRISVVTLNRPAKKNAVSLAMWRHLAKIFAELDEDASVRAVILTGRESFSAGADISEFQTDRSDIAQTKRYEAAVGAALSAIHHLPKPVIAAVGGHCVGGGLALAQACDFRLAEPSAIFGVPAAKLGIVYGPEECRQLASIVGVTHTKRILLGGERFDAAQAVRIGFVELCPEGGSLAAAEQLARALAENAPLSMSGMKFILNAIGAGRVEAHSAEIDAKINKALVSEDYREAVIAFREKRKAAFKGF